MLAQTPSRRPGVAPRRAESCWVSHRSTPRVGHGHDLGLHGVLERVGHEVAQHRHEAVGPL